MTTRPVLLYAAIGAVALATAAVLVAAQTHAPSELAEARPPAAARGRDARMVQGLEAMRQRLMAAGATEADLQAIEAHRAKQRGIMERLEQAMQSLRQAAGENAADPQAKQGVTQYEAAMKTALAELAQAEEELKARLSLSAKPKLYAVLLAMGVLENGMGGRGGVFERGGPGRGGGFRGPRAGGAAGPGAAGTVGPAASTEALDARLREVDPLLKELEQTGRRYANVPREHGRFLRMLVELSGSKNALEIGTSNGYSAIWIGLGLQETEGKLTTIEIVPEKADEARQNMNEAGLADVVTCVTGDALEVIPRLDQTFDFVFMDALKSDYWKYFELVRPKLKDAAVIAAHNAVSARDALWKYFQIVQGDPNLQTTVAAIEPRDGIAVTYVRTAGEK